MKPTGRSRERVLTSIAVSLVQASPPQRPPGWSTEIVGDAVQAEFRGEKGPQVSCERTPSIQFPGWDSNSAEDLSAGRASRLPLGRSITSPKKLLQVVLASLALQAAYK